MIKIETKSSLTKPEILKLIIPVLISQNVIEEEYYVNTQKQEDTGTLKLETNIQIGKYGRDYEKEFELEKLKMQLAGQERIAVIKRENTKKYMG